MKKYELTEEDVETLRNAKEAHRVRMNELLKISVKQIKEERKNESYADMLGNFKADCSRR